MSKYIKHIEKMSKPVEKLVLALSAQGISFQEKDGHLENVVFTKGDIEMKIAYHCFYRYSGMCKIKKEKGKHLVEWVDVTDDMFINSYMKSIIEHNFKKKEEEL